MEPGGRKELEAGVKVPGRRWVVKAGAHPAGSKGSGSEQQEKLGVENPRHTFLQRECY